MNKKILFCFEEGDFTEDKSVISFATKLAGISIFKRNMLTFQFCGGEEAVFIINKNLIATLEKELSDKRITFKYEIFTFEEIDKIKSALDKDIIFAVDKAVFERKFMLDLLKTDLQEDSLHVCVEPKFTQIQGNDKPMSSDFYLLSASALRQYPKADYSKKMLCQWVEENTVDNKDYKKRFYLKIDSKAKVRLGEKGLFKFLRKPTDSFISRNLNRPVSLFFSQFIMRSSIHPNMMTMVTLSISLIGTFFVLQGDYLTGAIAGFLFHMASIVDGCDGELARLKFQFTDTGEWLDGLIDDVKNGIFGLAIGIRSYYEFISSNPELSNIYLYSTIISGLLFTIAKTLQYKHLFAENKSKDIGAYKYYFDDKDPEELSLGSNILAFFGNNITKSDMMAFFCMIMGFLNALHIAYWFICAAFLAIGIMVLIQTFINKKKALYN